MSQPLHHAIYTAAQIDINKILDQLGVTGDELRQRAHIFASNYAEVAILTASGADTTTELALLKASSSTLRAATSIVVVAALVDAIQSTVKNVFLGIFKAII